MAPSSANIFRALADPTRRAVVELLLQGEKNAGELSSRFCLSQQAVSLHLQSLRKAGVVNVRREGRHRKYRLEPGPIRAVYEWSMKFKPLFDPYGHAWLVAEQPGPEGVPSARSVTRSKRRKRWS